jgi:hypothetical protein|tara:strand:- start:91 stop:2586 length:2496 start_codon:yes stop_codon:yes gene_type:complete
MTTQSKTASDFVKYLGLDQEDFNVDNYRREIKERTKQNTLTIRDALFITLEAKGIKILPKFVEKDANLKKLSSVFRYRTDRFSGPRGVTITTGSPTLKSYNDVWGNLLRKISEKDETSIDEVLSRNFVDLINSETVPKYGLGEKSGAAAIRQGHFYIINQRGFVDDLGREISVTQLADMKNFDPTKSNVVPYLYFDEGTAYNRLGGAESFSQERTEGARGLVTDQFRSRLHRDVVTEAIQEGTKVIQDADVKAAVMYNILIPHRAAQVARLRINPEVGPDGKILPDATDPYLSKDGKNILVPEEGQQVGQKKYRSVQLTPLMQAVFAGIKKNNPNRTYLFRDSTKEAAETAFKNKVSKALSLPGGVGEQTQKLVDQGIFTRPVNTAGMLRKLGSVSFMMNLGKDAQSNLKAIMGHTNFVAEAKDITFPHYVGDYREGDSITESLLKNENAFVENSVNVNNKSELLKNVFNIQEFALPEGFTEPVITTDQAAQQAQADIDESSRRAQRKMFEKSIENRDDLTPAAKRYVLGTNEQGVVNFTQDTFSAYENRVEELRKKIDDESDIDTLSELLEQKSAPENKVVDESTQQIKEALEKEATPSIEQEQLKTRTLPGDVTAEDFKVSSQEISDQMDFLNEKVKIDDILKKLGKLALGVTTGVAGVATTLTDAAAMALEPTELGFGGLDPVEKIRGTDPSTVDDTELFERMQTASSQRLSSDMAKRTTALADIEANRESFAARAFDAPSRMRAEQADLTELDPTTPELERMRLAETLQDVNIDTSEIDSMEARKARIAAQAAQIFNKSGTGSGEEEKGLVIDIENRYGDTPLNQRF